MRCCVPFCRNAADNVPASREGRRISFHGFPSDARLRAAWLSALGRQGAPLPDPAVVCSQHFLDDDIHETESGSRLIDAGAIPSTVLVCMMCLDTDSRMFLMSKHKLEEAYEYLTGYAPCNQGNLKQTLCVQCAQRLMNFSRFRDQSLRARVLMMDLVEKHELITRRHIKMINRTKNRLKSPMVVTTLGADFCDLHIQEDTLDDKETTNNTGAVTIEISDDSMAIGEDMDVIYLEDDNADSANNEINEDDDNTDNVNDDSVVLHSANISDDSIMLDAKLLDDTLLRARQKKPAIVEQVARIQDLLKFESDDFKCSLCSEEFDQEIAYMEHMSMHAQSFHNEGKFHKKRAGRLQVRAGRLERASATPPSAPAARFPHSRRPIAPLPASVAISNDSEELSTEEAPTIVSGDLDCRSADSDSRTNDNIDRYTNCIVKLYDVFGKKVVPKRDAPLTKTRTQRKPATAEEQVNIPISLQSRTDCLNNDITKQCIYTSDSSSRIQEKMYICDFCRAMFHMRTHTGEEPFSCKLCEFKSARKSNLVVHMRKHTGESPQKRDLVVHMRKHTGEKPFSCRLCQYKAAKKSDLVVHMRKHTGEKPYNCELCEFKTAYKHVLVLHMVLHMRKHTGERPYNCELCGFKTAQKRNLVDHMRLHTGEKPYSCELCVFKTAKKYNLVDHMRLHTGEKPYSCKLCEYKATQKSHLVVHMRKHNGEKPYSCKFCEYKSAHKKSLIAHMRLHMGEKPYSCELCVFKTAKKCHLVDHMRLHTGEKPYSCKLCEYKTAHKSGLVVHMRKHTREKPFSCNLCDYKAAQKNHLVVHNMRKHTGEKPFSCSLCEYKVAKKSELVVHMRKHTGEKPFSCRLCEYKAAKKSEVVVHMRKHTG